MIEGAAFLTFLATAVAIIVTPGADMAMILGATLTAGRRQGFLAVGGVISGALVHISVAAIGLSALLAASPAAMRVVGVLGAAYLVWVGVSLLRSGAELHPEAAIRARGWAVWRRAAGTNLLNPKAYLFMLAVFPHFLRPGGWPSWAQTLVLGAILLSLSALIYGGLVAASSALAARGEANPALTRNLGRATGAYLAVLGVGMAAASLIQG